MDQIWVISYPETPVIKCQKENFVVIMDADAHPSELRQAFKLTPNHLNCTHNARQKVSTAFETLSGTSASMFRLVGEEAIAGEVQKVNDFFDVSDSYGKYSTKKAKCGLGVHEELQMKIIEDVKTLVAHTTFKSRKKNGKELLRPHFLAGVTCNANTLPELWSVLKAKGFEYLATHKLTQDSLGMSIF